MYIELKTSNSLLILLVAGSDLVSMICIRAKWPITASKLTLINK